MSMIIIEIEKYDELIQALSIAWKTVTDSRKPDYTLNLALVPLAEEAFKVVQNCIAELSKIQNAYKRAEYRKICAKECAAWLIYELSQETEQRMTALQTIKDCSKERVTLLELDKPYTNM